MQMKDLKPHCYKIIVFRVEIKMNGVKSVFAILNSDMASLLYKIKINLLSYP